MSKPGPKPFDPNDQQREIVKRAAACGLTQEQIANVLGIGETTLKKYFQEELSTSGLRANMAVAGALYNSAIKGNVTAQIFWCKTRLGWKETSVTEINSPVQAIINFGTPPANEKK